MRLALLCLTAFLLLLTPSASHAQGENQITYGQTIEGRLTDESFRVIYAFRGSAGEIIEARMRALDGTLDPTLILLDAQNTLIAQDDDAGDGYNAALIAITLPSDGLYFLVATRFGGANGITLGRYSLTLNRVGIAADPRLAQDATELEYGANSVNELDNETFERIYTFGALRGDILTITMERISGDLDSVIILADAEGNTLLINDEDADRPGTLDAAIRGLRIERSGNYLLVASRFGGAGGTSRGAYSLKLTRIPPELLSLTAQEAALLEDERPAVGRVDRETLTRYYTFFGKRGEVISLEVNTTRGTLDPVINLLTSDERLLLSADSNRRGRAARIIAYRLPADGQYLVAITRFNGPRGSTEGDFSLTLTRQ
ncbi:MAG: hypothetical protein OHK0023_07190 [Anaerolineae bacterium]